MSFHDAGTLTKIIEFCRVMKEGDRVRVLRFCEAIRESRAGKIEARRSRHQKVKNPKLEIQND